MARKIKRVAVIGAGVMGSGIAAHLAGVGLETVLLDIVPPDLDNKLREDPRARSRFALTGLQNAVKARPAAFFDTEDARLVSTGNLEDDLKRLEGCDWILEAIIENLAIKQKLYETIERYRRPGTLVTSNTSGLKIADLLQGRSDDFRRNFLVTHFFNPPRYMRLLELVAGEETDKEAFDYMAKFGNDVLGKGIVFGKDTPNFVANRIGTYGMLNVLHTMLTDNCTVEEVDAVFGPLMGRPKSAVFRTADIVGLDTLLHVANNCYDLLVGDESREMFKSPDFLPKMVEKGWLGSKTKAGFYKKVGDDILALDLNTFEYRPKQKVRADSIGAVRSIQPLGERIKRFLAHDDRLAKLAWINTANTLAYSARRMGEIADDVVNIDNAMKWGFGWDMGPFEVWDAIGVSESVERMTRDGIDVPSWVMDMIGRGHTRFYSGNATRPTYFDVTRSSYADRPLDPRHIRLAALRESNKVVKKNASATLFDLDDGVLLLEFHTKMNAVDDQIISMMHQAVNYAEEQGCAGLVIGNEATDAFSAGANLFAIAMAIGQKQWGPIEEMISSFQQANMRLRYSDIPVVVAPAGLTLGGGAEITFGADAVRAHAETYIGLVEVGVGLIPGGGGTLEMLERFCGQLPDDPGLDPMPFIRQAFNLIGMAQVATSADQAKRWGMLRPHDGVTLNRDLLLHDAKQTVLGLSRAGYRRPRPIDFRLPGPSASTTIRWFVDNMRQGEQISDHDYKIAAKLAWVLCGGDTSTRRKVSQQEILDLEREAFLSLCGEAKTQERIQYMLTNNKPLRN